MSARLGHFLVNGALVLLSVAATLFVLELGLRVTGFKYHTLMQPRFEGEPGVPDNRKAGHFTEALDVWKEFEYDPELFWRPRAGVSVFNEQGFRGPVWSAGETEGVVRVATVGDSNTLGFINEPTGHWPGFVQAHFDEQRVEVLNAGVYGHSSHQGVVRLKSLLPYEPDIVTISYGANDAHMRGFDDRQFKSRLDLFKPFSALRLSELALWAADALFPLGDYDNRRPRVSGDAYRKNLEEMLGLCEDNGIVCVLLTRPFYPSHPYALRSLQVDPLHFIRYVGDYNAITREVAAQREAPLVDVAAIFEDKPAYFVDSNHFTEAGQRLMGDIIARELAAYMPDGPPQRRVLTIAREMSAFEGYHPAPRWPQWSESEVTIDVSRLTLRPGDSRVVLGVKPWRAFARPEDIGLRLWADGRPLSYAGREGEDVRFALPHGVESIDTVRLSVEPFVPKEVGMNEDTRALGLPLYRVGYE